MNTSAALRTQTSTIPLEEFRNTVFPNHCSRDFVYEKYRNKINVRD